MRYADNKNKIIYTRADTCYQLQKILTKDFIRMNKYISVIMLGIIVSASITCADDIPAKTEDGRGVILHDNGTWEFADFVKPAELKGSEQAEEFVKNLPCSRWGTVDQYLTKKAESPATEDLGWRVYQKEDGFEVERLFLINQKMQSKYRWHVYKTGKVKPLNSKAIGITKE